VTPEMLKIWDINMRRVIEPGVFELMVGPSSDQTSTVKLTVAGLHGETGKPVATAPIPPNSESGIVSTFDDGKVAANFGSWIPATDQMNGGKSTSSLAIVEPGAAGTRGALEIKGEVAAGGPNSFAGAMYAPGSAPLQAVNLSSKKEIRFWARGDAGTYTLMVLTESRMAELGAAPAMTTFVAVPEWKQYVFPFSVFETDGGDLSGIVFIRDAAPGKFQFQIDQVEIK
ncbi:MAG TPA: CIA30 family protein, partial [Terracidiphilus sp.]|nr:CIA30 family protein [Terracidiphilus sp.]